MEKRGGEKKKKKRSNAKINMGLDNTIFSRKKNNPECSRR